MASKQQRTIASFFARVPRKDAEKESKEDVGGDKETPATPSPPDAVEDTVPAGSRGRKRKACRRAVIESDSESEAEEEEEEYVASMDETESDEETQESEQDYVPKRSKPARRTVNASAQLARTPTTKTPAKRRAQVASPSSPPSAPATPDASGTGRFMHRDEVRFDFLRPERIRDAQQRRPEDLGYDPTSLYVPQSFLKSLTGGQEQWWRFKAEHFDAVLLFKMGKFYEMFEMDAHVGAEHLGLQYMKGEQPHCGFPEKNYHSHAERLARKGFRVVVIEQTETPEMLAERNKVLARQGKKKERVVKREKVAVLTKGTLVDSLMVQSLTDASYLLSVVEAEDNSSGRSCMIIGLCAVDTATSTFLLGQLQDDTSRSLLQSVLTFLRPVELVVPQGDSAHGEGLSTATWKALRNGSRQPLVNQLEHAQFGSSGLVFEKIAASGYFKDNSCPFPPLLETMKQDNEHAISALGGCISYLKSVLLDSQILPSARFQALPICNNDCLPDDVFVNGSCPSTFVLDAAALENLEVLENSEGGLKGSLLEQLDHCVSGPGKRLLRTWLVRPLLDYTGIMQRQEAIRDLQGVADAAAVIARKEMSSAPDMERALARLAAARFGGSGRDSSHVVLYEDAAKIKLVAFVTALQGIASLARVADAFDSCRSNLTSERLRRLVTQGSPAGLPELSSKLAFFRDAFDWEDAKEEGRIIPTRGTNSEYEKVLEDLREADISLNKYLHEQRSMLGAGKHEVMYVTVNKDTHRIEVPDKFLKRIPSEYQKVGQKKGFCRYTTPPLELLVKARKDVEEKREEVLRGIVQELLSIFASDIDTWMAATNAAAELDVLISLSLAATYADSPTCFPTIIHRKPGMKPVFRAEQLRHPCGLVGGGAFVPNDIQLGGREPLFMLLTGPNMGGKSTLLRQTCLAVLLAQIGACVPALSLEMTIADGIFVRMGARDNILAGQSTFAVELEETATLLRRSTSWSIVALDELGRGTATTDGAAIASAVMDYLAQEKKCRVLFSTHFHSLAASHEKFGTDAGDEWVMLRHMACKVTPSPKGIDHIAFLYQLTPGSCPKSYGMNVAQLAGLPIDVIERAVQVSMQFFAKRTEDAPDEEDVCSKQIQAVQALTTAHEDLVALWKRVTQLVSKSAD